MTSYKEKIQRELKKAMERFQKQHSHPFKGHIIQKKQKAQKIAPKQKRTFRPLYNQFQKDFIESSCEENSLFNFYNILTIDESALRKANSPVSYMKNMFYTKTTRKIEIHENYLVLQLTDNCILPSSVSQTLEKYRNSSHEKIQKLAILLQNLQRKLSFASLDTANDVSITEDALKLFDSLGNALFLSKIAGQKLVISKSFLKLCNQDIDQFVMESLIHKIPVIEGPLCVNYYQILIKQIENYSRMIDFLQGSIPLSSFIQISKMSYFDQITTRDNVRHRCVMSLSMPIPLVQLTTIDEVIDSQPSPIQQVSRVRLQLKNAYNRFESKSYETLQYLIGLPQNKKPSNYSKVAQYNEINNSMKELKSQDCQQRMCEKTFLDSFHEKSSVTNYVF